MVFCEEASQLLDENSSKIKEGDYIKLMELLKENYNDDTNCSFARYILNNPDLFDKSLTERFYNLILIEFDYLEKKFKQEREQLKKQIEIQNEIQSQKQQQKDLYDDLKMFVALTPIHILLTYFFYILI